MKFLIKVSLLFLMLTLAVRINSVTSLSTTAPSNATSDKFNNSDDQTAYSLGASLGFSINHSLAEQQKLGIKLNKNQLITGIQDAVTSNSKLSNQEIDVTMQRFEARVKQAAQINMEQEAKDNSVQGNKYRAHYVKQKGVKRTTSGVLYKVINAGTGNLPTNSDTVVVFYKGTLVDGSEFDNSYKLGEPLSFRLDKVISGWNTGLKNIKKNGKIQLVIPDEQAYGKNGVPGIPANSTLVFDIELVDIKPD